MIKTGSTKFVIVIKILNIVIKFANIFQGLTLFYHGLYTNKVLKLWKKYSKNLNVYIPIIYYVCPFGFFTIEEYCRELTDNQFKYLENKCKTNRLTKQKYEIYDFNDFEDIDFKYENFGFSCIKNKIVILDYIN